MYDWELHNPQVVKSPIVNDCPKIFVDGQISNQVIPKLLLQV